MVLAHARFRDRGRGAECAFSLPGETLTALGELLGEELPDLVVSVGPAPARVGALATASGRHVAIASEVARLPAGLIAELLGHELAHLVQQRRGRVEAQRSLRGVPLNESTELEGEADRVGRRFARGLTSSLSEPPVRSHGRSMVVQRLVSIGGRAVTGRAELPPEVASVVSMIRGAQRWLEWAAADPIDPYAFDDSASMVAGIQDGLHGSPWTLLPRLGVMVSPVRLLELAPDELSALASYEAESSAGVVSDRQVKKILSEHDLISQDELEVGLDFLDEMGLRSNSVFQSLSLADQIELFRLVDSAQTETKLDQKSQKEASAFAVRDAHQPMEFIDYYRFYMCALERGVGGKSAAKRMSKAQELADGLSGRLYGQLKCPTVDHAPSLEELKALLGSWLPEHGSAAFPRLSAAVSEVFCSTEVIEPSGGATETAVDEFLSAAQSFLAYTPPSSSSVAQDGWSRRYLLSAESGEARLAWDKTGQITLESLVLESDKGDEEASAAATATQEA